MADQTIDLTINNREGTLFQGKVKSITSFNERGKFDVLFQHANFISLLNKSLVYKDANGNEKEIPVSNGIIKVERNKAQIYLGIGE